MSRRGANTYPPGWYRIAERVKLDAGNRCARCGHHHEPSAGYCLTVHHFDFDRDNNARWNLMPLCQRCHLSVQARVSPEQGLMFDPSPWAMPYVAGAVLAGASPAPPGFDLPLWRAEYEAITNRRWPDWMELETCPS